MKSSARLKINSRGARQAGDFELAEEINEMREEIHRIDWQDFVPYANIIQKFVQFTEADKLALKSEKRLLEKARGELEFEGQSLGEDIEERDIEKQEQFEENTELINQRRKENQEEFEESQERQREREIEFDKERAEFFRNIEDEKRQRELAQRLEDTEFFDNIAKNSGASTSTQRSTLSFGLLKTVLLLLKEGGTKDE